MSTEVRKKILSSQCQETEAVFSDLPLADKRGELNERLRECPESLIDVVWDFVGQLLGVDDPVGSVLPLPDGDLGEKSVPMSGREEGQDTQ